jgi:flavorubredoxin
MPRISEVAPDIFQITEFVPEINLQFNHFLVRDDEPLLFHTGYKRMFPLIQGAVATLIDPSRLRWISFSHFESDECGALNEWLTVAPQAEVAAGFIGVAVNLADFAIRPPRAVLADEAIETGKYRFRFIPTAQIPHGWDAGVLFEETQRTLFCSDLMHQWGDCEPFTSVNPIDRARDALRLAQSGPFANYVPFNDRTERVLHELADLQPRTLAAMHGSTYLGDVAQSLRELAVVMREELSPAQAGTAANTTAGAK